MDTAQRAKTRTPAMQPATTHIVQQRMLDGGSPRCAARPAQGPEQRAQRPRPVPINRPSASGNNVGKKTKAQRALRATRQQPALQPARSVSRSLACEA
eukprot:11014563-Alexandrium_andersonii.AAC.1